MRTFLLFLSVLVSICLGVFSYMALTSQIGSALYILLSLGISILLVFLCGHAFSELHIAKRTLKKSNAAQNSQNKVRDEELQALQTKIANLEAQLQKAQQTAKTDLVP